MPQTLHAPHLLTRRSKQRTKRLLALDAVADSIVSVAGLTGAPVVHSSGAEVGRVVDLVVRWEGESYPPLTGAVVRVGRRLSWVPADKIHELSARRMVLGSVRLDLRDFSRRDNEVKLIDDVIDHQMVDVDGVRVFRAADLVLARVGGGFRLVGADVGFTTLLRRLGPARFRTAPHPDRLIDWAAIQPFSDPGEPVRLTRANNELKRLRPGELADLLEELGRSQRQELLDALDAETAADALVGLLDYDEETAGGVMTTSMLVLDGAATVAEARRRLQAHTDSSEFDGVLVVDAEGVLVDNVRIIELFTAEPDQQLIELTGEPWPVTVSGEVTLEDVVEAFRQNRGSSVVVVDEEQRPIGRILADDLVDALVPDDERGFRPFAGLLS